MSICLERGCPVILPRGENRCPKHKQEKQRKHDETRREQGVFYWSAGWRKLRDQVIQEEATCSICGVAPSTEVDHIEPVKLRPDLALTRTNLRGACKPCHSRRTRIDLNREQRKGEN